MRSMSIAAAAALLSAAFAAAAAASPARPDAAGWSWLDAAVAAGQRLAQAGATAPAVAPPAAAPPASSVPTPAPSAAATGGASATVDPAALPAQNLVLLTRSGRHDFTVEIADDPIERQVGLMFREQMARNHGMLFDFAGEEERSFWMKNTILPLDLVFARADGTVVSIGRGTPHSLDSIPSDGPARFVLEVNAGVAAEIGLAAGDRLVHRRIAR